MAEEFTKEQLLEALRAFRKRLKVYRQDDESSYGGRGLTSGKTSGIFAVRPPQGYPPAIWQKLVEQGRLVPEGNGTYSIKD